MATIKTWRKEAVPSAGGTSWRLVTGRAGERVRMNLGRVTEVEADRALASMQVEEQRGDSDRVLAMHRKDPAGAVEYLLGDPAEVSALPPAPVDYGRMPLRTYVADVFAPIRSVAKPKSWRTESSMWKRILADLGHERLCDIDVRTFYSWARDLQILPAGGVKRGTAREGTDTTPRAPRPASGQYKSHMRMTLQACLTHAYLERHVDTLVKLGEVRLKGSTERVNEQRDPLSLDELAKLLEVSEGKHRAMWAVAVGEGLRPSEVCRMQWQDVDLASGMLMVRGDSTGKGKTRLSLARIPLTPIALAGLQLWFEESGKPTTGLVFTSGKVDEDGNPLPYKSSSVYRSALAGAAEAAGITRKINPYLLRHSFATIAWTLGVDRDTTRRIGRWANDKMLDEVYCRPRPEELVKRVAAFTFAKPKAKRKANT